MPCRHRRNRNASLWPFVQRLQIQLDPPPLRPGLAEDVILKKMEAYREGGSEKHLRDIAGVLKISGERLDRSYIQDWADRLGVTEVWQDVLRRVSG